MANKKRKEYLPEAILEDYNNNSKRFRKKRKLCDSTACDHFLEKAESSKHNSAWRTENLIYETGTETDYTFSPSASSLGDLSANYSAKQSTGIERDDLMNNKVSKSSRKAFHKRTVCKVQTFKSKMSKEGEKCDLIPSASNNQCNSSIEQKDVYYPSVLDVGGEDDSEGKLDESFESLTDFDRFVQENGGQAQEVACFASRFDGVDDCPLCDRLRTSQSCDTVGDVRNRIEVKMALGYIEKSQLRPSIGGCAHAKLAPSSGKERKRRRDEKMQRRVKKKWGSSGEEDESSGSTCSDESSSLTVSSCGRLDLEEEARANFENFNTDGDSPSTRIPDWMYVAIDCEMVGVGPKGRGNALARCSVVDFSGKILYDRFVRPDATITDYRTRWSGVRPDHMRYAEPMEQALADIHKLLEHKIIVGHSVYNDFRVLKLNPAFYTVRDTAQSRYLIKLACLEGRGNGLKKLAGALLGRSIQTESTGHCSVEDARASLDLFKLVRQQFEAELYTKWARKAQTMSQLARYLVDAHTAREEHPSYGTEFLQDQYWPSDVID